MPPDKSEARPELTEPAITSPEASAALAGTIEPAAEPAPDRGPAPDREPTRQDFHRVTAGFLRGVDRILSFVLRVDRLPDPELEDFVAMIVPAAELYGPKVGPVFWIGIAAVAFSSFVLAKLLQRMMKGSTVQESAPDVPATEGPVRGRRLGGSPHYPEGAGR